MIKKLRDYTRYIILITIIPRTAGKKIIKKKKNETAEIFTKIVTRAPSSKTTTGECIHALKHDDASLSVVRGRRPPRRCRRPGAAQPLPLGAARHRCISSVRDSVPPARSSRSVFSVASLSRYSK